MCCNREAAGDALKIGGETGNSPLISTVGFPRISLNNGMKLETDVGYEYCFGVPRLDTKEATRVSLHRLKDWKHYYCT
jgi:hypothetical protein